MRVAIVTGICVPDDAISAAVASQAGTLVGMDGVERVDVFAQACTRPLRCDGHVVHSSWELLRHPTFQAADVAIFHWGIHFDLFDAIAIMRGRVANAPGPSPVVHFHNCTPRELVPPDGRENIDRSLRQIQLVADTSIPVWTFSEFNERTLLDWGVRADQIGFVPFAVEPPRPLRGLRRSDGVDLVCVGRMVPAKAQHVAIEALAALPAELRESMRLRIAGNAQFSSAEYVRTLRAAIARHGLESVVEIVGQPSDAELWELYERSHVLLATSQHEGLCVPVLEAYHAGCRVIGSDSSNLPFVVRPPDPVVPVLDVAALAGALERVAREVLAGAVADRSAVDALLARYSAATARERLSVELERVAATAAA